MYQTSESGLGEEVWVGLLYSFIHFVRHLGESHSMPPCHRFFFDCRRLSWLSLSSLSSLPSICQSSHAEQMSNDGMMSATWGEATSKGRRLCDPQVLRVLSSFDELIATVHVYIYIYIHYIHTHNFIYIYDMSFWVHLQLLHALLASVRSMDVEGLWQKRCCQRHAPCGLLRSSTQVFIVFFLSDLELLLGTYDFSHRRLPAKAAWCDPWRKTLIIKDSAFGHEKMIQVCLAPSHQV